MKIAVVSTSSVVPKMELAEGLQSLRDAGMTVSVAANCDATHFLFAGNDSTRVAEFERAANSDSDVIWCANGGYGAARLLPLLEQCSPPPHKTLIGFSDVTALLSFARTRWGWRTIHAPMVASNLLAETLRYLQQPTPMRHQLRWLTNPCDIAAEIVGGNLAVWTSLTGTPYAESVAGKILFLEDVDEPPYRIDRLVNQLKQSGSLDGVAAIVLGAFTDCDDRVKQVRSIDGQRVPVRRAWKIDEALAEIFGRLDVPVAMGLPVGHGGCATPLPLGVAAQLHSDGSLFLH
jgi:muramoyltetrapeptide carboxypeptidase